MLRETESFSQSLHISFWLSGFLLTGHGLCARVCWFFISEICIDLYKLWLSETGCRGVSIHLTAATTAAVCSAKGKGGVCKLRIETSESK